MLSALFLLVLLSYCSGVAPQPTLTQPPTLSVPLTQTVKLSCIASSNMNTIYWQQQRAGQAPRFVHCNGCSSRGAGIPDRFTASASGNTGYLTITNVDAEDEADYYCGMWYSNTFVFGGGTQLIVTGQPSVPPTVMLFPPSPEEIQTRNKATLVCLITEFHPGAIQVAWLADGKLITEGVETAKPTKQNDKYVASSYLTMSDTDWNGSEAYTCKVTHEERVIEKLVRRSECP